MTGARRQPPSHRDHSIAAAVEVITRAPSIPSGRNQSVACRLATHRRLEAPRCMPVEDTVCPIWDVDASGVHHQRLPTHIIRSRFESTVSALDYPLPHLILFCWCTIKTKIYQRSSSQWGRKSRLLDKPLQVEHGQYFPDTVPQDRPNS